MVGFIVFTAATNSTLTLARTPWYSTAAYGAFVQGNWKGLGSYGTIGLEIALGIMLPSYVGHLVDQHYGTGNWFFLVGFFFGMAHGVRAVWRLMKKWQRDAEEDERKLRDERNQYYEDRDPDGASGDVEPRG